jgi:hypothetical protein
MAKMASLANNYTRPYFWTNCISYNGPTQLRFISQVSQRTMRRHRGPSLPQKGLSTRDKATKRGYEEFAREDVRGSNNVLLVGRLHDQLSMALGTADRLKVSLLSAQMLEEENPTLPVKQAKRVRGAKELRVMEPTTVDQGVQPVSLGVLADQDAPPVPLTTTYPFEFEDQWGRKYTANVPCGEPEDYPDEDWGEDVSIGSDDEEGALEVKAN